MSLADYIPAEFLPLFSHPDFARALEGYFTYRVKEDSKFRESIKKIVKEEYETPDFKNAVDTAIVLSDNKILPRLRSVEKVTGNYDFEEFEAHEPTLKEEITEMKEKLNYFESSRVIVPATMEPEINEDLLITKYYPDAKG